VPHPHQRDAVWRIVTEPNVLLGHAVGAQQDRHHDHAQELKRLGLVTKSAYVVPNLLRRLHPAQGPAVLLRPSGSKEARDLSGGNRETEAGHLTVDEHKLLPAARLSTSGFENSLEPRAAHVTQQLVVRPPV